MTWRIRCPPPTTKQVMSFETLLGPIVRKPVVAINEEIRMKCHKKYINTSIVPEETQLFASGI